MANIQQVRYPGPEQPSPWVSGLQSISGLAGGFVQGKVGAQQQEQQNLMKLLPVLAQMKMLTPGGKSGQPGVLSIPGGPSFTVGSPSTDYGQLENKAQAEKIAYENANREQIGRQKAAEKAFQAIVSADPKNLKDAWAAYKSVIEGGLSADKAPSASKWQPSNWEEAGGLSKFLGRATWGPTPTEKLLGPIKWGDKQGSKKITDVFKPKSEKRIRVKLKGTSQYGTILADEWDPKIYERE